MRATAATTGPRGLKFRAYSLLAVPTSGVPDLPRIPRRRPTGCCKRPKNLPPAPVGARSTCYCLTRIDSRNRGCGQPEAIALRHVGRTSTSARVPRRIVAASSDQPRLVPLDPSSLRVAGALRHTPRGRRPRPARPRRIASLVNAARSRVAGECQRPAHRISALTPDCASR